MAEFEHSLKAKRKAFQKTGEFYTPEKLARYMRTFLPDEVTEVYDPTCGSGNLLKIFPDEVKKYGQELNAEPLEWCRENIPNFEGYIGDLLEDPNPAWVNKKFDAIIANPPYSVSWESKDEKNKDNPRYKNDERFKGPDVLAPKSKADFAFVQHILHYLSDKGKAAVLVFPGIAYRGAAEGKIRKWMVEQNWLTHVIDVPQGQFEDTTVATLLWVFDKGKSKDDTKIKFVDSALNIERMVDIEEIRKQDYNLSVSTYVQAEEEKDIVDLQEFMYLYFHKIAFEFYRTLQGAYMGADYAQNLHSNRNPLIETEILNNTLLDVIQLAQSDATTDKALSIAEMYRKISEIYDKYVLKYLEEHIDYIETMKKIKEDAPQNEEPIKYKELNATDITSIRLYELIRDDLLSFKNNADVILVDDEMKGLLGKN